MLKMLLPTAPSRDRSSKVLHCSSVSLPKQNRRLNDANRACHALRVSKERISHAPGRSQAHIPVDIAPRSIASNNIPIMLSTTSLTWGCRPS